MIYIVQLLLHTVDDNVFYFGVLYEAFVECFSFVCHGDVFKREVGKPVFVACADIKEILAVHLYAFYHDVVTLAQWHILALIHFEKLCPRAYYKKAARSSGNVFHCNIFIVLRSVWAHLQPKYPVSLVHLDIT